ncbi:MAG: ATP-binding cassette domain-containing protein [Clostridiales bacterium]|nr:MAG: ATP-binding cassette domain-containing protein [Clostridiales bacterium]
MIAIENLTKTFDGNIILDHITSNIKKGSIYGLIGTNGAGKSTLFEPYFGHIFFPTAERFFIADEDLSENVALKDKNFLHKRRAVFFFNSYTMTDMAKYYEKAYPSFSMEKFIEISSYFSAGRKQKKLNTFFKGYETSGGDCYGAFEKSRNSFCATKVLTDLTP